MLGISCHAWRTIIILLLMWSTMAPMSWTPPEGWEGMEFVACIVWTCIVIGIIEAYSRLKQKCGWKD